MSIRKLTPDELAQLSKTERIAYYRELQRETRERAKQREREVLERDRNSPKPPGLDYSHPTKEWHRRKRGKNPIHRAEKLYESFRERKPTRYGVVRIPSAPKALMVLGYCSAIEYETTHGRAQGYRHKFHASSRPLLASDGKRLYLVKGRFRITSRGIVDILANGREEN